MEYLKQVFAKTDWQGEFVRASAENKKCATEKRKYKALPEHVDIKTLVNYCGDQLKSVDYSAITTANHETMWFWEQ